MNVTHTVLQSMLNNLYEIILGFVAFLVLVSPYVLKLIKARSEIKKELDGVKKEIVELKKKYSSSSFVIDLFQLNSIKEIVDNVFHETHMDRFLILSAMNGKDDFAFVSALYEQHTLSPQGKLSMGATSKYIDLQTDDHYKKMVKYVELMEPFVSEVEKIPEGILKEIYRHEEIKHTMIIFCYRQRLDKDNDRVFFVSWSTHEDRHIDYGVQMRLKGATKRISELLKG